MEQSPEKSLVLHLLETTSQPVTAMEIFDHYHIENEQVGTTHNQEI